MYRYSYFIKALLPVVILFLSWKAVAMYVLPESKDLIRDLFIDEPPIVELNFSGLMTKTRYLQKDIDAWTLEMLRKQLVQEKVADKEKLILLFKRPDENELESLLEGNALDDAPVVQFMFRAKYASYKPYDKNNNHARMQLAEKYYQANPTDREGGRLIYRMLPVYVDYGLKADLFNRISFIENLDPWLKELFSGGKHIYIAWKARGGGWAHTVTDSNWKIFHRNMAKAKVHLESAFEIDPLKPEPLVSLCGPPHSPDYAISNFRKATDIQADYPQLPLIISNLFLPRWLGIPAYNCSLALACLKSPFRDTMIPDYGIAAICQAAYEGNNYSWQNGLRNTPGLGELALEYLRIKASSDIPEQAEDGAAQKICFLTALGRYDEAMEEYKKLTPKKFDAALKRFNKSSRLSVGGNRKYFSWVDYPKRLNAFTGAIGKELVEAENTFLDGYKNQAVNRLISLLKRDDLKKDDRDFVFYLYQLWEENKDPSYNHGSNEPAWITEIKQHKSVYLLSQLLLMGFDPDTLYPNGSSALMQAIRYNGDPKAIKYAINIKPSSIKTKNSQKWTVLSFLCRYMESQEIAELLIDYGADLDHQIKNGLTPLMLAVSSRNKPVVDVLLKHCANITAENRQGWTLLHYVAKAGGNHKLCEVLINKGIPVDSRNKYGATPLMFAILNRNKQEVSVLLKHGADVMAQNFNKWTLLHYAAKADYDLSICEMLMEKGIPVDAPNNYKATPLMLAAMHGNTKWVKLLIRKGADILAQNVNRWTMLHYVVLGGKDLQLADELMKNGISVNAPTKTGTTPLIIASGKGNVEMMKLLIERGAQVNAQENNRAKHGHTPLHAAVTSKSVDAVKLLLAAGADISLKDKNKLTPLQLAQKSKFKDIVQLLEQHEE
ncbi:MAG: ankyrin repeat domain-containing protein [Victivallales bacterium]|nr:ankyrin repeat domain-containing protein [Victivallales bacterium]